MRIFLLLLALLVSCASATPRDEPATAPAPEPAAAPEPEPRHGPALIDADAPSIMLYTSGTTGRPKGVLFTERNAYYSTVNFSLASRVDSATVFLCEPPLFHTAALIAVALFPSLATWLPEVMFG